MRYYDLIEASLRLNHSDVEEEECDDESEGETDGDHHGVNKSAPGGEIVAVDEVVDKVAERHSGHEVEHTGAEGDDRRGGEDEIAVAIVGKVHESYAGDDGCCDARDDGDGAVVDFPGLETLFDEKSAEGGKEHDADGGPVAFEEAAEGGVGGSSEDEHCPVAHAGDMLDGLKLFVGFVERNFFGEHLVGESAQAGDGVEVDAGVCEGGDAGVGVLSRLVPKGEEHVGRHDGEDGFHVPGFGHLFHFALDAHGGGAAGEEGAGVVAEEFGDGLEMIVHFARG